MVIDVGNGLVHLPVHLKKCEVARQIPVGLLGPGVPRGSFSQESQHLANGDSGWRSCKEVAAIASPSGFYEAGMLQLREDCLEKTAWDSLSRRYASYLDWFAFAANGEFENRFQGIFAFT